MSDKPWRVRLRRRRQRVMDSWQRWGRDFWLLAVTCLLIVVTVQTQETVDDANTAARDAKRAADHAQDAVDAIERESMSRINETCTLFETDHLADVDQLKETYRYLRNLPRSEQGTSLTQAVVRGLGALEREARADPAPEYCDRRGVGLKEPDPRLPKPRTFRYLLERR